VVAIKLPIFLKTTLAKNTGHSTEDNVDKPFNLIRSYSLTSLVVMLIIGGLSGILFSSYHADSLIRRDAIVSQDFLQSFTEAEGGADLFHGKKSAQSNAGLIGSYGLAELVNHIATMPGVVRANLFSDKGIVLWSSQSNLIGKQYNSNPRLETALEGNMVFKLKDVGEEHKNELLVFGNDISQMVENYLPIWDLKNQKVVAVVEIYKVPKFLFDAIDSARTLVWVNVVGATLFLYATLFWIVYRANRVIQAQQLRLVESETFVAIGEMASAVAHSIRNPLAAIRSSAEITTDISDDSLILESAEDIIIEIDRVEQWVRELIILCRSEGTTQFNSAYLDQILKKCLNGYAHVIKRNQIQSVINKSKKAPAIKGDTAMLGQMFNSLFANALEAMPNGGSLTTEIKTDQQQKTIQILISDTGYGIPEERLDTMFETCLTTKRYGLGIGMLLVKRIVDKHDGSISLSSQVGIGTTACLRFPIA
jgi:two-component system sensor histidine kinase HydH